MQEPILEPLLRKMRIGRILPYVQKIAQQNCTAVGGVHLLDVGCGWEARFLKEIEPHISSGIGIDIRAPSLSTEKIKTISAIFTKELPFDDDSFDVVTLLAVLEHMDYPLEILKEIHRVLKPNAILIGTVPSKAAKPVLEFLAYKLKIVSSDEIRDHKEYYTKTSLKNIILEANFSCFEHQYFQLGMNNFFVCKKGM